MSDLFTGQITSLIIKTIKYKIYWKMRRSEKAIFCACKISMRDGT
jgi:hypothetical protein